MEAVLDGTYVTQLRTGAATGAAFDLLAKKDCRVGALIGTGGQAATQLEAMVTVRDLEEVRVYDMNPERTKAFAEQMNEELKWENVIQRSAQTFRRRNMTEASFLCLLMWKRWIQLP